MIKTNLDHAKRYDFSDILDFVKYATEGPKPEDERCSREGGSSRNRWCGGTWDDAVKQATTGNPEMVKRFFEGVNVISAMIEDERVGEIRDVTGEYFDVADFLSGEPEVFRRKEMGEQKPVIIPVYANFSMHCEIDPEVIRNRGCGIISLCDELSKNGFIVDLHLVEACRNVYPIDKCYTNIKVCVDPLDLDTAAFIIANPLCLRRVWFGFLEHALNRTHCGGYGSPIEYDLQDVFETGISGFYFTSSTHSEFRSENYRTLETTKTHILEMIEKFKESPEQVVLG